jgi:hypothetical protein
MKNITDLEIKENIHESILEMVYNPSLFVVNPSFPTKIKKDLINFLNG